MDYKKLATLVCRVFSIFLFYRFLGQFSVIFTILNPNTMGLLRGEANFWRYLLPFLLPNLIILILGFLFWIYAKKIASIMVRGIEGEESNQPIVDYSGIEVIAFSVVGLSLITIALPSLIKVAIEFWGLQYSYLVGDYTKDPRFIAFIANLSQNIIQLLIGTVLLLKVKGIVAVIRNLRKA